MKILSVTMSVISVLLVIVAIYTFFDATMRAETAIQQAVAAGQGCFFAALARIAQASGHQFEKLGKNELE